MTNLVERMAAVQAKEHLNAGLAALYRIEAVLERMQGSDDDGIATFVRTHKTECEIADKELRQVNEWLHALSE